MWKKRTLKMTLIWSDRIHMGECRLIFIIYSIHKSPCHFEEMGLNTYCIPTLICMNKWTVKLNQIIRLKEKCNQDVTCQWKFSKAACDVWAHSAQRRWGELFSQRKITPYNVFQVAIWAEINEIWILLKHLCVMPPQNQKPLFRAWIVSTL